MADKENRAEDKAENNIPPRSPDADDIRLPGAGASLPPAMVHRDFKAPLTKAD